MRARRHLWIPFAALTCLASAQDPSPAPDIASLVQQITAQSAHPAPDYFDALDRSVQAEPLSALQRQIPAVLDLADLPDPPTRFLALDVLFDLENRKAPDARSIDLAARVMLVPYIARIAPKLHDPDPPTSAMAFEVLQGLSVLRPAPPELLNVLLEELRRPDATTAIQPPPDQGPGAPYSRSKGPVPAPGPEVLFILLAADATLFRDPSTGIPEGRNSPEIQAAVIEFIRRKDQIPASLAETMRAISLAQPQNTEVNAALIPFLDSSDPLVLRALLSYMNRFSLAPETYAAAHAKVEQIAANANAPVDERTLAKRLLGCWHNNRHEMCDPSMQP